MAVILASSCLLGCECRYKGDGCKCDALIKLAESNTIIGVCPEQMGGLPTPRSPAEIVAGQVINRDGVSVDREFRTGAAKALEIAREQKADLAILQSRSPSCGVKEIYDGSFTGRKIPGQGVFAALLQEAGIPVLDARHHFVWEHLPVVQIGRKADHARFLQLLMKLVLQ